MCMIPGAATASGTRAYAQAHKGLQFNPLGRTKWHVGQAGFGCYRVSAGIGAHFEAMTHAITNGINVIDTSTNYTDGGSERLVGRVLRQAISKNRISRDQLVVVSKVGYLQAENYELSQARKRQGNPFPELVPYGKGLEHCIHPEFIQDQLSRSLDRLELETLDLLLLHNPEYYLAWAARQAGTLDESRNTFYQRIRQAFEYLEKEVALGRIQAYGISANTFPGHRHDAEFVSLARVWEAAQDVSENHHFRAIQLPLNLFETGAVTMANQRNGQSVLDFARRKQLGVLVNRPLNAFQGNRLMRLADVEQIEPHSDEEVIQAISLLNKSEKVLWRKHLPELNLPTPLYGRVMDQISVGDQLKHHWRNFGSYGRWRQFKDGLLWPHVQGVFDFLEPYAANLESLEHWLRSHKQKLEAAVTSVGSLYVHNAVREITAIKQKVRACHVDWNMDGPLSQLAIRVLRTTSGIHTVLVGMRQARYVNDVLEELARPAEAADRTDAWIQLQAALTAL